MPLETWPTAPGPGDLWDPAIRVLVAVRVREMLGIARDPATGMWWVPGTGVRVPLRPGSHPPARLVRTARRLVNDLAVSADPADRQEAVRLARDIQVVTDALDALDTTLGILGRPGR